MDPQPLHDDDRAWTLFRAQLERATGVSLRQYKEPQMRRRLATLMARHGFAGWPAFARALHSDSQLLAAVQDTLTINVSEFYRQADRFLHLEQTVLPDLLSRSRSLRIWSAGCSIGCEPYTLAIILSELDPAGRHTIIATDIDALALGRARSGAGYQPTEVRAVPPRVLDRYFERENDGTYRVDQRLKPRIQFRRHDLLKDPYPVAIDLILCRNVVIYFTEDAKRQIFEGFAQSLRAGGMLFVGGSEMLIRSHELGLRADGAGMYRKSAA
jgi:chemotaxis protein methyltransferase CheR